VVNRKYFCHTPSIADNSEFDQYICAKRESLLSEVEAFHREEFWIAYIKNLDLSKWNAGSEYTLYCHYALRRFSGLVETRHLNSCDFVVDASINISIEAVLAKADIPSNVDAIGLHNLVQMQKRFDPCRLTGSIDTSKSIGIYRIYLIHGNVEIVPWSLELA
jgi:hypothetical protein